MHRIFSGNCLGSFFEKMNCTLIRSEYTYVDSIGFLFILEEKNMKCLTRDFVFLLCMSSVYASSSSSGGGAITNRNGAEVGNNHQNVDVSGVLSSCETPDITIRQNALILLENLINTGVVVDYQLAIEVAIKNYEFDQQKGFPLRFHAYKVLEKIIKKGVVTDYGPIVSVFSKSCEDVSNPSYSIWLCTSLVRCGVVTDYNKAWNIAFKGFKQAPTALIESIFELLAALKEKGFEIDKMQEVKSSIAECTHSDLNVRAKAILFCTGLVAKGMITRYDGLMYAALMGGPTAFPLLKILITKKATNFSPLLIQDDIFKYCDVEEPQRRADALLFLQFLVTEGVLIVNTPVVKESSLKSVFKKTPATCIQRISDLILKNHDHADSEVRKAVLTLCGALIEKKIHPIFSSVLKIALIQIQSNNARVKMTGIALLNQLIINKAIDEAGYTLAEKVVFEHLVHQNQEVSKAAMSLFSALKLKGEKVESLSLRQKVSSNELPTSLQLPSAPPVSDGLPNDESLPPDYESIYGDGANGKS